MSSNADTNIFFLAHDLLSIYGYASHEQIIQNLEEVLACQPLQRIPWPCESTGAYSFSRSYGSEECQEGSTKATEPE
jgi:hypothetical protein